MAQQMSGTWQKYRNIIISIFLFLVLDTSVLVMNFYISFQISQDALGVNLSGRQRMLSQRMTKALLEIGNAQNNGDSQNFSQSVQELQLTRNLFNETLHGFDVGATVTGADGKPVFLKQVTSKVARTNVNDAKVLWAPYVQKIDTLLNSVSSGSPDRSALTEAIGYALANNLTLLNYMNNLTVDLEHVADSKARTLRMIQTGGIILALINFFIIMFHFMRQLRESDARIEEARQETTEIMQTVNEGLFLVDKDLNIGSQYSARLEEIIGQRDIGGKKLAEVLSKMVSSDDLEITQTFIEQLYSEWVVEDLITDLNPLRRIRVEVDDFSGYFNTRFLDFKFSRVYHGENIERVLVSVSDVTEAVMLEDKLAHEREQNDRQIEMLSTVLNADPGLMSGFISSTKRRINDINETLRRPEKNLVAMQDKARRIYREIHGLKGESSAMNLHSFVTSCEGFEEKIKDLQARSNLSGNDFLSLTVMLDEIMNLTTLVENLNSRISGGRGVVSGTQTAAGAVSVQNVMQQYYTRFAEDIARRNSKKVSLLCRGMDDGSISATQKDIIKDISVQLLRNAIVHGIEMPGIRRGINKAEAGNVQLLLTRPGNHLAELTVEDDGAGINFEAIRSKAVERGLYDRAQADALDKRQLIALMFDSGFSTAATSGEDAGRGVGMDIIKERIKDLGGKLKVASVEGQYTRFTIAFPLA